jgi:hypothetical protein
VVFASHNRQSGVRLTRDWMCPTCKADALTREPALNLKERNVS